MKSISMKLRFLLVLALVLPSCSEKVDPNLKPTFPVSGVVTVDGKPPGSPIKITVHDQAGLDKENPTLPWALTDNEGKFSLNTYEQGDGVPVGKYKLTFFWGTWNALSMSFGGEDKLNKRYSDPSQANIEFAVDGTGPIDLGTIELTTK